MRSYDVIVLQDVGGVGLGQPDSINRSGQSVGWSATSAFTQDAVLWSPSGKATVLQDVGGDNFSQSQRRQQLWTKRRIFQCRHRKSEASPVRD